MPVSDAYAKLIKVDFGPLSDDEKALHTEKGATGNGGDQLLWKQADDTAIFSCKLNLTPLADDAGQTNVTVTCHRKATAAETGHNLQSRLLRNEFIERVDAALTGRPFDEQLAQGATASGWPSES